MTTYPVATIAKLLLLTERRVQQLTKDGILPKAARGEYELAPVVQAYIRFLRDQEPGEGDHKQRLMKARADLAEIEADRVRGTLLPRTEVHVAVTASFARVRAKLLALPSKLAPIVITAPTVASAREKLSDGINDALAELAATRIAGVPVPASEPPDAGGGGRLVGSVDATADPDGQPVGGP